MTGELDELLRQLRLNYLQRQPPTLGFGRRPALLVVDFIEGFTSIRRRRSADRGTTPSSTPSSC